MKQVATQSPSRRHPVLTRSAKRKTTRSPIGLATPQAHFQQVAGSKDQRAEVYLVVVGSFGIVVLEQQEMILAPRTKFNMVTLSTTTYNNVRDPTHCQKAESQELRFQDTTEPDDPRHSQYR